jgi:pimeloyl-ACP methyl ester carboxylesterase
VRRYPHRVDRLILMSCGAPRSAAGAMYSAVSAIVRALPLPILRRLTAMFLSRRLVHAPDARGAALRALTAHRRRLELVGERIGRELMAGRFRMAADVHRAEDDIRSALQEWRGRILLLIARDDPLFSRRSRNRIRAVLPRVEVHTFDKGGHLIPLFNREEMQQVVIRFASEPA